MAIVKWDVDIIGDYITGLKPQIDVLEKNKGFLNNLNKEINDAWQGYAGTAFDGRMHVDMENYEKLRQMLDDFCNEMLMVKKDYQNCEDDIKRLITSLKSKIG